MALAPSNRDYLIFMGVLLHETGNWEEAADYLSDALDLQREVSSTGTSDTKFENEEFEVRSPAILSVCSYLLRSHAVSLVADLVQLGDRAQGPR